MIIEILSIILGLIAVGCIWVLKGGSIKGFIIFILVFVVGGLGIVVGMDHLDRRRQARLETETINEAPELYIEIQEGETELEVLIRTYSEQENNDILES